MSFMREMIIEECNWKEMLNAASMDTHLAVMCYNCNTNKNCFIF